MGQFIYQEIFYTSSEKGIFSGNAGFGVRTCTRGMDSIDVDKIVEACATGYAVYNERILDMDRILANPDIVYDYPPVYLFRTVDLNDGSKKYVFGRTVYLGVDYGFFKGINAYDRAGTNYLTHLLIFGEKPSIAIIRDLFVNSKYLPKNYSCSPTNSELQELLTGSPEFLTEKIYEPEDKPVLDDNVMDYAPFIMGIVQMLKNRQSSSETDVPKKMYVKCPWKNVESCLKTLDIFPHDLLDRFQYITNYMQGYGIPDGFDLAFVNEFNEAELYEDNYITVDLFAGTVKNISKNPILTNIGVLVKQHDAVSAAKLIQFYLDLKDIPESEYDFYYDVFLGAVSDLDVKLSDLNESTLKKLNDIQLDQTQSAKFWGKINKALNDGLTSTQGSDFLLAVEKIKQIKELCPGKVQIKDECVNYVTNILFSGRGNFGKIVNDRNVSTLLQLVNKNLIASEDLFLTSLGESSNTMVWEECLSFYYNGNKDGNLKIITAIIDSNLPETEKGDVLLKVFPLSKYAETLFDFIKTNPTAATKVKSTVTALVTYFGEKRFSDFVWLGQIEPGILNVASPIISSYYQEKVSSNVKYGISSLFDFLEKVGCDQISTLNLWSVVKIGTQHYLGESINDIKGFLSKVEEIGIPYQGHIDDEIELLKCLADHEIPSRVSSSYLSAAIRLYPGDANYIERLFSNWLETGVRKDEIKSFIVANKNELSDSSISNIIKTIWGYTAIHNNSEKESMVLALIDNCGWDRKKVEEFSLQCGSKDLEKFLLKSNGFFDKLVRKIFK